MVATATFAGFFPSIAGGGTGWSFIGPTATVTITATQRLSGNGNAPMALGSGGPQSVNVSLCYQLGAGAITTFMGSAYSIVEMTTTRFPYSQTGSVVPGVAGAYTVGYCVWNSGALAISDNDYVQGYVQVTN